MLTGSDVYLFPHKVQSLIKIIEPRHSLTLVNDLHSVKNYSNQCTQRERNSSAARRDKAQEGMAKFFRAAVLGPPGSGKGTICKRIAHSFGLQYLSSGHFLREGIAADTEAGVLAKTYIERGMLVPDQVMTRLMLPKLEQLRNHSWLLDVLKLRKGGAERHHESKGVNKPGRWAESGRTNLLWAAYGRDPQFLHSNPS
ncbi:hypothetical protein CRENBAI_002822 [Crenichthys baileyi]|uniref:Nucleoside-diphosphate kinase n=1 Tax=Crenichthys baileyi TaxID=28760 RepID=A0AAV9RNF3_9TELE